MIEMLITMMILAFIFLAVGSVLLNMIKTSNVVSSRVVIRGEGEYLEEVFRKYIRNSSADSIRLYARSNPRVNFSNYEVSSILGLPDGNVSDINPATEIHFRPTSESGNKIVCIGFFESDDRGYVIRTSNYIPLGETWSNYNPEWCFPSNPIFDQEFRKNFVTLNTDLVFVDGLEIRRARTSTNAYYSVDIDMQPAWGVGGLSNYKDIDGAPKYRKSFVVQTRQIFHW